VFLFLKVLDRGRRGFRTLGTYHIPKGSSLSQLENIFMQRMHPLRSVQSGNLTFNLFKESSRGKCCPLKSLSYWSDVLDGDIIFCVEDEGQQVNAEFEDVGRLLVEMTEDS
jgi:hypothetical protein